MIENISVIGFVDFAIGIANQNIILTHVGPVCAGIGRGKVTQLVLFDGVLRRLILRGAVSPILNFVKSAINSCSS